MGEQIAYDDVGEHKRRGWFPMVYMHHIRFKSDAGKHGKDHLDEQISHIDYTKFSITRTNSHLDVLCRYRITILKVVN